MENMSTTNTTANNVLAKTVKMVKGNDTVMVRPNEVSAYELCKWSQVN